ncbi:hypothetical protein CEE37_02290 [candidate division LCP-89 bacterium B3_LCP]|uniref:Glycosyltransferase subfamily 4-like N-terminal domain-containing protein n=1 Tax=candidate division LCP-89 bacterium B3_LCP TaxID=2012998 RepID=A0A532V5R7_UNCL8|nr:MAG: hypothetical protein CEE37_02290 [candidate division LCP-89 bacterium B3_LCP]
MHLLFYSNWYIKQTVQLANALAEEHEVTLIFPKISPELNAYNGRVEGLKAILKPGVRLITLPHMQNLNPFGWIPVLRALRIIKKYKPDVVHFNESYDFRCMLLMALCRKVPYVTSTHDPVPHSSERISLQRFKHWVRDRIRRRSSGLVVHGKGLRKVLADYSNLSVEKIFAVPHGEYKYYTHFDKGDLKHKENGNKNVLFFGRWEYYKGIDVLIDAEPIITDKVPDTLITLAGEGRLSLNEIDKRIANPDHFIIKNYSIADEEVPDLFRQADVVVLPYREATQSGPLHIAGSFARPVVVSSVGAMPEVVKDGETGILIPPEDPEELAQAVIRLLQNPAEAERMGQKAQALMASEESMEKVAQIQVDVYNMVIQAFKHQRGKGIILKVVELLVQKVKNDPSYQLDSAIHLSDLIAMSTRLGLGFLRGLYHRISLKRAKGLCFVGKGVKLSNRKHISIGCNFVAEDNCEIQGISKKGVKFGDNVTVGSHAMVRPSGYYGRYVGEGFEIGDRSNIGPYCYIGAYGGITIGSDVMMAPRVSLFAENHNFDRTDVPMHQQGCEKKEIVIEDDCWLASGCTILAGVTVGHGSIIAAGAVVTKNVPPYSVVAGNPAKVIRSRKEKK